MLTWIRSSARQWWTDSVRWLAYCRSMLEHGKDLPPETSALARSVRTTVLAHPEVTRWDVVVLVPTSCSSHWRLTVQSALGMKLQEVLPGPTQTHVELVGDPRLNLGACQAFAFPRPVEEVSRNAVRRSLVAACAPGFALVDRGEPRRRAVGWL